MGTLETPPTRTNTNQLFARISLFAFFFLCGNIYFSVFHGTVSHGYQRNPTFTPIERFNNAMVIVSFFTGIGGAALSVFRKEKWTFIKVLTVILNGIVGIAYGLLRLLD